MQVRANHPPENASASKMIRATDAKEVGVGEPR